MNDLLQEIIAEAKDAKQHGIKGQKWGVRKDQPGSTSSGSSSKLHDLALRTFGEEALARVKKDKIYWQRAAAITGVGLAGLAAAAVAPAVLPVSAIAYGGGAAAVSSKILASTFAARVGASIHNSASYKSRVKTNAVKHDALNPSETVGSVFDKMSPTQKAAAAAITASAVKKIDPNDDPELLSVWQSMTDSQRAVVEFFATVAESEDAAVTHADMTGGNMVNTTAAIMALPAPLEPIRLVGDEDKHATMLFFGETSTLPETAKQTLLDSVKMASGMIFPFSESVVDVARLGSETPPALVAMLTGDNLSQIRNLFMMNPAVKGFLDNTPQFDGFTPHVTLGHPDFVDEAVLRSLMRQVWRVRFDRLAVWWNDERFEFSLDGSIPSDGQDVAAMSEAIENVLSHHGIKGQKWGVRKDQIGLSAVTPGAHKNDGGAIALTQRNTAKNPPTTADTKNLSKATVQARNGAVSKSTLNQIDALNKAIMKDLDAKKYAWNDGAQKKYEETVAGHMEFGAKAAIKAKDITAWCRPLGNNTFMLHVGHPDAIKAFQKDHNLAHASMSDVTSTPIVADKNALGLVIGLRPATSSIAHTDSVDDVLSHIGVKLGKKKGTSNHVLFIARGDKPTAGDQFSHGGVPHTVVSVKTSPQDPKRHMVTAKPTPKSAMKHFEWESYLLEEDDHVEHHGIKGQKWGVRRFVDKATGRVEQAGRTGTGSTSTTLKPRTGSADQIAQDRIAKKLATNGSKALSNADIQAYTRRLQLQADLDKVIAAQAPAVQAKSDGFVKSFVKKQANRQTNRIINAAADIAIEQALKQAGVKVSAKNPEFGGAIKEVSTRIKPKKK